MLQMSKLNVGDYVRTKHRGFQPPQIAKIKSMKRDAGYKNQYYIELDHNLLPDYNFHIYEEDIEKARPRIIDLIEVGDYVNGCPVLHKENNELVCGLLLRYKEENIQNVVTKEQFEKNSYKVGE